MNESALRVSTQAAEPSVKSLIEPCFCCTGQSVYWQSIFQKTPDPTFVLLAFIWHAMYAWDEALESLYAHICTLVRLHC